MLTSGGGEMHIAGVVAEYNPFHNGHRYHLEKTREMGADRIVVVMSGDVVQRGDVAIYSKYDRAQIAIDQGADLVIELPAPYSCSCAQVFALNAMRLFAGLGEGVVNSISFGCACASAELLEKAQSECEKLSDSEVFKELISSGLSYPAAMQAAAEKNCSDIKNVLNDANNILGIEYINAAKSVAPWIKLMCIQRSGALHNDLEVSDGFASATMIRKMIKLGSDLSSVVPQLPQSEPAFIENMDKALLFRIITADEDLIEELPFITKSLENRFFKAVQSGPKSVAKFEESVKSRDITMARIRRMVIHLALGINAQDMQIPVPYARILAMSSKGTDILSAAGSRTLNYDTSLSKLETDNDCRRVAQLECNAVRLREMCAGQLPQNEYTRKFVIRK